MILTKVQTVFVFICDGCGRIDDRGATQPTLLIEWDARRTSWRLEHGVLRCGHCQHVARDLGRIPGNLGVDTEEMTP